MKQSEKLDTILRKLYEFRYDRNFYSVDWILSQQSIELRGDEADILAIRLENDGYAKRAGNISSDVMLTSWGVDYCENDSYTYKGKSIISNNYTFNITNSPNSIINNQSPNSIITTGSNNNLHLLLDEIKEKISSDNTISPNQKEEIVQVASELQIQSTTGEIKKDTFKNFLDKTSKISSIGSFIINLLRLISGF